MHLGGTEGLADGYRFGSPPLVGCSDGDDGGDTYARKSETAGVRTDPKVSGDVCVRVRVHVVSVAVLVGAVVQTFVLQSRASAKGWRSGRGVVRIRRGLKHLLML